MRAVRASDAHRGSWVHKAPMHTGQSCHSAYTHTQTSQKVTQKTPLDSNGAIQTEVRTDSHFLLETDLGISDWIKLGLQRQPFPTGK